MDESKDTSSGARFGADDERVETPTGGLNYDEEPEESDAPPVKMDVYNLLFSSLFLLRKTVWSWLGLQKNPFTGTIDKDLTQARVAIDTMAFIAERLDGHIPAPDLRELRNDIANLRLNFVQQSQMSGQEG